MYSPIDKHCSESVKYVTQV